ncbi:MAG: nicotinate-nucleotide adenylyltransferase [Alphaproteobacteria bacterium]|nr:nicotinate-nucleotide adenylyltransferase [Alphaproteobacteria bacterium]
MIVPHPRNGQTFRGMRIGLLGGSFNPAHEGHRAMSLHALKALGLDQVWWLVCPQNPLKDKEEMASLAKRLVRAERFARHPRFVVTAIEAALGTTATVDTLRQLKKRFPGVTFIWLMGADNLRQIPKWQKWTEIFRLVPVAVFRRPSYPAGKGLGLAAIRFDAGWAPSLKAGALARQTGDQTPAWTMLDNELNETSATEIRKDNPWW